MKRPWLKWFICLSIPAFLLWMPAAWLPFAPLTLIEQRVMALFVLAALLWITEPIPAYATSLLIVVLSLVFLSDRGWIAARTPSPHLGVLLPYQEIMACFASPIVLLFLGGFFLALAAQKYRLDQNLARLLLRPFGDNPRRVMLGMMGITAFFSMFMSNTATTVMMLSILAPVLEGLDPEDKGRIAFALSIPVSSNIGGLGTPIGTPPNAVALKYLLGPDVVTFGQWMLFGVPVVCVLILIAWLALQAFYPLQTPKLRVHIEGRFRTGLDAWIVYATFVLTILLWLTDAWHGMNAYIVALLPVAVFSSTQIVHRSDLKNISWDILWLVTGGLALGLAIEKSGLARKLVASVPFQHLSPLLILVLLTLLATLMANFMSHTATANLLLPLVSVLTATLPSLTTIGGTKALVLAITFCCSLGMALPISTPPNALAHATGLFATRDMAKIGLVMVGFGLVVIYAMLLLLKLVRFF